MNHLHRHLRHLNPSHEEPHKWVIIMFIMLLVALGVALGIQRPEKLYGIPLFGPTASPTPLASRNITVEEPLMGSRIGPRFIISGKARVFEQTVSIRVKEKLSGRLIGETTTTTDALEAGIFGNYRIGIALSTIDLKPKTDLILEVYQESAHDGSEIDKVIIPITFDP